MRLAMPVYFSFGLCLFFMGMALLCRSLKRFARSAFPEKFPRFTGSTPRYLLLGLGVTALLQSSSAVTVMAVGLVEGGFLTLKQALGILMGANIGTTVTAQLLRLPLLSLLPNVLPWFRPTFFAYLLLPVCILLFFLSRRGRGRIVCGILAGLAMLFIGMHTMELAASPLQNSPLLRQLFAQTRRPLAGVALGTLSTALLQSSSICIGILQALSASGSLTWASAIPLILGQNIGTSVTALLASLGTHLTAKRTALLHLYFNVIGTAVFLLILYVLPIAPVPWQAVVTKGEIANFHTLFNTVTALFLAPFSQGLIRLAERTLPAKQKLSF